MSQQPESLTPQQLLQFLSRHRMWLIAPAVVGAVLAAASTFVIPRNWHASQGLVIRSDAAGYSEQRLGKFTDLSEMKTVQETLLELARSRSVVSEVLKQYVTGGADPSARQIEDFRDNLRFNPPGGAEFGKTEVFYLGVLDPNRDLAIGLVGGITDQLEQRMQELRDQRARSLVDEVERSVVTARELLQEHAERLGDFEQSVGADLIELRYLVAPSGGQSESGQRSLAIDNERRQSIQRVRQNQALLDELKAAEKDPTRLITTPDTLLAGQPGLRQLKSGLVEAQLAVARLSGARTQEHPYVLAARQAQEQVAQELARELPNVIASVELEITVAKQRDAALSAELNELRHRSAELAGMRSEYAELIAAVEGQTRVLEGALKQLTDAKAHLAGASSASLLARIDGVETGVRPVGPSRKVVTAAGGMAGLLFGGALLFLLHSPSPATTTGTQQAANPNQPPQHEKPWAIERVASPVQAETGPAPIATTIAAADPTLVSSETASIGV